jgi:hypothetical protein
MLTSDMWDDYTPARYQVAAICQRGHVLTADADYHLAAKFCAECGAPVQALARNLSANFNS